MILWTIQPEEVYKLLLQDGVFRCDFSRSKFPEWKKQYDWLVAQMIKRIGKRPFGVSYPIWAWFKWEGKRKRPDLRRERWGNGWKGARNVRLEIDVPDADVLLSDFDAWNGIMNNGLLSDTEEEDEELEREYLALSDKGRKAMKDKNWERVFDVAPFKNKWTSRGDSVQATFWELRKEYLREATPFVSARPRPEYLDDQE